LKIGNGNVTATEMKIDDNLSGRNNTKPSATTVMIKKK
jgi:hypothetical protein